MNENELQNTLNRVEKKLAALEARQRKRTTVSIIAWVLLLVIIAAAVFVAAPKIAEAADTVKRAELVIDSAADALEGVDTDKLSANLAVLGNADTEKLRSFVTAMGKIDFKALSEQLDSISAFGDKVSQFNTEALEGASEALGKILDPLKGLFGN